MKSEENYSMPVEDGNKKARNLSQHFAIFRELTKVYSSLVLEASITLPIHLSRTAIKGSGLDPIWSQRKLLELVGDVILSCFDSLGPVYGKAGQVALSRLSGQWKAKADQLGLSRLYGGWPEMPFSEVEAILDSQVPDWHQEFVVEPHPIGVASMAQVHVATDEQGRKWVMKVMKPHARKRLSESLDAIDQLLRIVKVFDFSSSGKRAVKELEQLSMALRDETDLRKEKANIDRMRKKLSSRKQHVLKLPETLDDYCSEHVLTVELFQGTSLSDVVSGAVELSKPMRRHLAKHVLSELLVQVFELGLFHGDPHAGNLILLDDGSVGLFDWGLTGELVDEDRKHISALLKAVIGMNMEKLVDALVEMAADGGVEVERSRIEQQMKTLASHVRQAKESGKKLSLQELLESCLSSAEKLEIPVPDGLLLMAKSLLTIEGLAKGIDPEVAMARIATPVLFKAAKPSFKELVGFSKRLPKIAGQMLKRA